MRVWNYYKDRAHKNKPDLVKLEQHLTGIKQTHQNWTQTHQKWANSP